MREVELRSFPAARLVFGALACVLSFACPERALAQGVAAPGYASTDFATGFSHSSVGPVGIAFDPSGNVFISESPTGFVHELGASGGAVSAATRLNSVAIPGTIAGLAFDASGRLFVARQSAGDVLELDPASGLVLRTVVSGLAGATGIETDPLSGDLFVSTPGFGRIYRVEVPPSGPGTATLYLMDFAGYANGMAFGSDGTLYAALWAVGAVAKITGTDEPQPPTPTILLTGMSFPDGISVAAGPGAPLLYVNRNTGVVTKIDLGTTPPVPTDIFTGGSRGDLSAVGPDHCLYITQTDRVVKLTNADGSCLPPPLGPLVPNAPPVDTTPPSCALTNVVAGPPKQLQITVQDSGSGLASIAVTASTNASTPVPAFAAGTTGPVVVTSTKLDQGRSAQVALRVTDAAGNVTDCDPIVAGEVARSAASSPAAGGCSQGGAELGGLLALGAAGLLRRRRRPPQLVSGPS
jgi:hypothetical protein